MNSDIKVRQVDVPSFVEEDIVRFDITVSSQSIRPVSYKAQHGLES
jgi:hypothetical protein